MRGFREYDTLLFAKATVYSAREVLKHITQAMKPGYSSLIVCAISLPPSDASLCQTCQDISLVHLSLQGRDQKSAGLAW